jgi:hypothetical protein
VLPKQIAVILQLKLVKKILIRKNGILRKAESKMEKNHGLTAVHTIVTTRIQCGTKDGKINFQRATPFSEEILI